ncbi:MAG: SIS domain-containing protein [Salibacteraceae bacterium]
MQRISYRKEFEKFLNSPEIDQQLTQAGELIKGAKRLFFIGNGGSNSICSHMMEDFAKIAGYPTFAFSDAALITCYANDYGYEAAMAEWLKIHFQKEDLLVAISSSGNSANILNGAAVAKERGGKLITLSGFKPDNQLRSKGDLNIYTAIESYGIVECLHQTLLHIILDEL